MKFKVLCTIYTFVDEQMVRALDSNCRITKSGRIIAWLDRKALDKLEQQHIKYTVLY